MELPSKWYPLPLFPTLPALLVSTRFGESSYTLHVTDLANMWVEKLDRRGILLRSLQENTSIDLVDAGSDQWAVFLSKLKAAFDPSSSDHLLTSLSIATATASEPHSKTRGGLTLRITCELPKPLDPLIWPIHLVKCQPVSLASELVLPLIQGHYVRRREAEDLMSQLKEKDAIITKLLDKLSTMHAPLELIFNSLSAKHAVTRAAAEERIKGLAPFDEATWRSQQNVRGPSNALDLFYSVFNDPGFNGATYVDLGVPDTLNDWWAKLGSAFHAASKLETDASSEEQKRQVSDSKASSRGGDDGDFQMQVAPMPSSGDPTRSETAHEVADGDECDVPDDHLSPLRKKPGLVIGGPGNKRMPTPDLTTSQSARTLNTAEDDTASGTEDEEPPEPPKHTRQPNARLGVIRKPRRLSSPTETSTMAGLSAETSDETAPGSDSGSDDSTKFRSSSTGTPATPRKGGLGRIGGRSKDTTSDGSTLPRKTEARKIGAIGKKPHVEPERLHPNTPLEPREAETEEQKAERKRAELAKELNRQGTVPAKKKRKF
ncbi:hypothetical protein ANO14919_010470 [Xylariales sp. No.14919]|nr:XLF-domain-containing protein [Xylaria grammica]GAW11697.1 hypothetical protein ANO14919_010470 [Xylariales sp. No.14919]